MRETFRRLGQLGLVWIVGCAAETESPPPVAQMTESVFAQPAAQVAPPGPVAPAVQMPAAGDQSQPLAGAGAQAPVQTPPDPMMTDPMMADPMMADPMMADPMMADPMMADPMMTDDPVTTEPGEAVPAGDHCASVADWDPMWAQFEEEVLVLTNEARAVGHNCDTMGEFGPAGPLTMNAMLRCSARLHSMDMGMQGYFAHESQDGTDPFQRMAAAGYAGRLGGENIAKGQQSPQEVVAGWLDSDGHCANIMNPGYAELGVGYWEGEAENRFFNGNKLWTQNFGASGGGGTCWWCP